ncbi:MAG: hypothetical protein QF724_01080 [Planctomycetota bacterium]|jgi:hypothetical protein|nr:hypothetical protein [Planctomycetota bacterium]MDP6518473.1 hypothetical protein [Planctomycetota bacterium]MDP6837508.1 hypothetical protein [Planctomycetota bacterium]
MGSQQQKNNGGRSCPTRTDGAPALFAHRVSRSQCQDRQRERYHKCYTCAWNNAIVATHGEPVSVAQRDGESEPGDQALEEGEESSPAARTAVAH